MSDTTKNCPFCDADQPDWLMLPGHETACMACTVCGARWIGRPLVIVKRNIERTADPARLAWDARATAPDRERD